MSTFPPSPRPADLDGWATQRGERAAYLRSTALFAPLDERTATAVAAVMEERCVPEGAVLIERGVSARGLWVFVEGQVDVRVEAESGREVTVATLGPGDCVGEMALLSGEPTTARIVATTETRGLHLDRVAFDVLVAREPATLRAFVSLVTRRVKSSNAALAERHEKELELTRFLQVTSGIEDAALLGRTQAIRRLRARCERLAASEHALLITGEAGTGKEGVAQVVHYASARARAPLLATDCARIDDNPWGDPIFGDRGPGARRCVHYMGVAEGGTLLLENIERLPSGVQERLFDYLAQEAPLPVRVMATSRLEPEQLATTGALHEGLLERLGRQTLHCPPLRERKRDIPPLAEHFRQQHAAHLAKHVPGFTADALSFLVSKSYAQANLRELREAIERAVVLAEEGARISQEEIFVGPPVKQGSAGIDLTQHIREPLRRALRFAPAAVSALAAAAMAAMVLHLLLGPRDPRQSWSMLLAWQVWWPALMLWYFFAGRQWCSICPLATPGVLLQRVLSLQRPVPAWLKRHDHLLIIAGIFLIFLVEEAADMRHHPTATALLLLAIMGSAAAASVVFPRRTWCRHLCPLGGIGGAAATCAVMELRATPDLCAARCTTHHCFKGTEGHAGCPTFQHVMFLESNQDCTLCLRCLRACDNGSPRLVLRPPAAEHRAPLAHPRRAAGIAALFLGLVPALAALQVIEHDVHPGLSRLLEEHRPLTALASLLLFCLPPLLALWWRTRRLTRRGEEAKVLQLSRRTAAWLPLLGAALTAYHIGFLPALDRIDAALRYGGEPLLYLSPLALLQRVVLVVGLGITAVTLWSLDRREAGTPRYPGLRWAVRLGLLGGYTALVATLLAS